MDGGILELVVRAIEVECLPGDIPGQIDVEVSDLAINQSLRVSDLQIPAQVKVVAPAAAAAPVAEGEVAAAPAAEPEVIKKGKKEEEGEAPAE